MHTDLSNEKDEPDQIPIQTQNRQTKDKEIEKRESAEQIKAIHTLLEQIDKALSKATVVRQTFKLAPRKNAEPIVLENKATKEPIPKQSDPNLTQTSTQKEIPKFPQSYLDLCSRVLEAKKKFQESLQKHEPTEEENFLNKLEAFSPSG